jgi:hypothetical protein
MFSVMSMILAMWVWALGAVDDSRALAAEESAAPAPAEVSTQPAKMPPAGSKRGKKGKRVREKEAEGTEAADRFEAHTVIKSKYSLNGESLEVDPD